jgi:putative Mg2+ transporter-C (MgtC) family protein
MVDTLWPTVKYLGLAFILGSVIGFEREKKGSGAGLRTHILVCVGSTLIMMISTYIYAVYQGKAPVDPARIAAGVVTGIGFLGAGTIIRSAEGTKGLTSAASIWVCSAIGLAVGCGYIIAACVTTAIVFLTLFFLKIAEKKIEKE